MTRIVLAAAANTEVPAYQVLVAKGYRVERVRSGADGDQAAEEWLAESDTSRLIGNSPLQLLGLVALLEARGGDWRAFDEQIDEFLRRFP